ncbi:MAG: glycosyltransferase [Armatimonadetes bacterium]|nr:glycosyltransferase [Armatimonadota bacterium]MBS1727221.1 glycosyltransferase [Armatimonadota bacterium]
MTVQDRAKAIASAHKIAIVHDWLTVMGGAEEVLRSIHEILPEAVIHAAQYNSEKFSWLDGKDVRSHWVSGLPLSKTKHFVYAPVLADCYRSFDLSEYDVVITSSHTFAHNARPRPDAIDYCYYHSPARALWFPEIDKRAGSGKVRQAIVKRLKKLDLEGAKNPTYTVANSSTTAGRLEKVYRRPVEKVIYPGVNVEKWRDTPRESDSEGYTMWSRLIPYKKFDLAIEAARLGGFKLNIVGSGPYEAKLKEMAAGASNIVFHGRLSDADLKQLLSRSRGVLFPAYEDFGIVPVEAMAAGLPVVVYNQGGAAETVTAEFGEHISEQTPEQLWEAVQRLEQRSFDPEKLKEHAQAFSVERFQREFVEYLELAIERGPERRYLP